MTIGFLHLGAPDHGVTRYGRVLAQAAREHLRDEVLEARVEAAGPKALREAAGRLAGAGVVHVQYNERIWGGPRQALANVQAFAKGAPPLVATCHDVQAGGYGLLGSLSRLWRSFTARFQTESGPPEGQGEGMRPEEGEPTEGGAAIREGVASLRRALRYLDHERHNARAMRWLARQAARVLVCSREERRRLGGLPRMPERAGVIPHFVEQRTLGLDRHAAQQQLNLSAGPVLSVLGFIHRKKGHALALEALPLLPPATQLVFAGRPGRDDAGFAEALRARARRLGVAGRLRITGYLEEAAMERYLAATDLALCPFREMAASGSLSTWIAAGRPVLASDLPQIREYNQMVPGALATFAPRSPQALARAVREQLARDPSEAQAPQRVLQERLAPKAIIEEHTAYYRQAAGGAATANKPSGLA